MRLECALAGRRRRAALVEATEGMDGMEGEADNLTSGNCTMPLTLGDVEELLWSLHLAQKRQTGAVLRLTSDCYAVLRDEDGMEAQLPGGYSILHLRHDQEARKLSYSCSCPAYTRSSKRFGGKSMWGGAKLCMCGTLVLLARMSSRSPQEVIHSSVMFSSIMDGEPVDDAAGGDGAYRQPGDTTFQDGIDIEDVEDVDLDGSRVNTEPECRVAPHAKQAARAGKLAEAMMHGPRLQALQRHERQRLRAGICRLEYEQTLASEDVSSEGAGVEQPVQPNLLFPFKLEPLEVLHDPVNPDCPSCNNGAKLLRIGEREGRPAWVMIGKVLSRRRHSKWHCSSRQCSGGLMRDGHRLCMGVPWTQATGLVSVQSSFFVDRITLAEMYRLVFEAGNPVLVAAEDVAERAFSFMCDHQEGWEGPNRAWLLRMLYAAFWWTICMTKPPVTQQEEDAKGSSGEHPAGVLLSEEELYAHCELRLVSYAAGGVAVQRKLPVYRIPPILHSGIRGQPRNTEALKLMKNAQWASDAYKDLQGSQRPSTACFAALSSLIADGLDVRSLRGETKLSSVELNDVLSSIGATDETKGMSDARKRGFLTSVYFALAMAGETDCHNFDKAALGTGGLANLSCPHTYQYGWKFIVGGQESVRDHKDMLMSMKCFPPVTLIDVPCGLVAHMQATEPEAAKALWGKNRGCWREYKLEAKDMNLSPITIPDYEDEARALRMAAIADAPETAELLSSKGERLLDRHPLQPTHPVEGEEVGRCVMCDAFHQGLASESHKHPRCRQHAFRMCHNLRCVPTTFMESANKRDRLHLRSLCVQDPGMSPSGIELVPLAYSPALACHLSCPPAAVLCVSCRAPHTARA